MTSNEIVDQIRASRLFLILRHFPLAQLETLGPVLSSAGVSLVEVALNSADALQSIEILGRHGLTVGAGTALEPNQARRALEAGARYLVSPVWDPFLPRLCSEYDAVSIPGAFTPTEAWQAHQSGAHLVKVFPASAVGPDFFKAVLAPMPELQLVAVGGVREENAAYFLQAGATALGVGSGIFKSEWITEGRLDEVREAVQRMVRLAQSAGRSA